VLDLLKITVAILMIAFLICGLKGAGLASGGELVLGTKIAIKETYDDNIHLTEDHTLEDFITIITPQLNMSFEREKSRLTLDTHADIKKYFREDDLDTTEKHYDLYSGLSFYKEIAPDASHRFDVSFDRDTSVDSELEASGRLINDRDLLKGTYIYNKWFSDVNRARVTLNYQKAMYEDIAYMDYDAAGSFFEFGHGFQNERVIMYGGLGYNYAEGEFDAYTPIDNTSEVKGGRISYIGGISGLTWNLSPLWNVDVFGGVKKIKITYDPSLILYLGTDKDVLVRQEDIVAGVGNIAIRRQGEKSLFTLRGSRDIVPSGEDISIDKISFNLNWHYDLTAFLNADLNTAWSASTSVSNYFTVDSETCFFEMTCHYELMENFIVSMSFKQSWFFDHQDRTEAVRNVVFINLDMGWDHYF